jgi:hypothetical protein
MCVFIGLCDMAEESANDPNPVARYKVHSSARIGMLPLRALPFLS